MKKYVGFARSLENAMSLFTLVRGAGAEEDHEACVMTAAGWMLGADEWSDHTPTVCNNLRYFYISLNDRIIKDEDRKLLWPHAKKSLYTELGQHQDAHLIHTARYNHLLKARAKFDLAYKGVWRQTPERDAKDTEAIVEYLKAFDEAIEMGSCLALAEKERQSHE